MGTTWDWLDNGMKVDGQVTLLADNKMKYRDEDGVWSFTGGYLTITFLDVEHKFILTFKNEGILLEPKRDPRTKIKRKGWFFTIVIDLQLI